MALPVLSCFSFSAWLTLRRSAQIMLLVNGWFLASSAIKLCMAVLKPTAAISFDPPAASTASRIAAIAVAKITFGSCSAHVGWGAKILYPRLPIPLIAPDEENTIALVLVVPISTPIKYVIIIRNSRLVQFLECCN